MKILINHIGYESNGSKRAVIMGGDADEVNGFRVVDSKSGQTVYSGNAQRCGRVDKWREWHFWTADFDDLQTEGQYSIECDFLLQSAALAAASRHAYPGDYTREQYL
ncbi:cellulase N-terminal Ig-like domain-containing protein [Paenibacillus aceti]|uniref:Cellulase Ig-like domain-containing protein n=1 Tax=Paenibacillus aceti TaxID=1820010 RepID=A0ABQ1VNN7_9BACL|nr:cellulase N-terminal Ig-like domain-containing protein [Paenibacillus aceti]GGF84852.1 hypothetical protein GCM10010913_02830 [Paenibacillus aceti]